MRSYRTLSPLPVPQKRPSAVYSLLHFPSSAEANARALPGTLPFVARTFLHRCPKGPDGDPHFVYPLTSYFTGIAGTEQRPTKRVSGSR